VVGSCNIDVTAYAERLPAPGETVAGREVRQAPGGKGANQAAAAALAGAQVTMIGAVGDDPAGAEVASRLARAGVDISLLRTAAGPTGSAHITVAASGINTIVVIPGANAGVRELTAADEAAIAASDALLLQLELPAGVVAAAAAAGRRAGALTVLTPAPVQPVPPGLLAATDLLVPNEREAGQLAAALLGPGRAGASSATAAPDGPGAAGRGGPGVLATLLSQVPAVAITLGADGCRYGRRDGTAITVPAPAVPVADTTGAGDTFAATLTVALAEGSAAAAALRFATCAAALCVQRPGAIGAMPARDEIDAFARELGEQAPPGPGGPGAAGA